VLKTWAQDAAYKDWIVSCKIHFGMTLLSSRSPGIHRDADSHSRPLSAIAPPRRGVERRAPSPFDKIAFYRDLGIDWDFDADRSLAPDLRVLDALLAIPLEVSVLARITKFDWNAGNDVCFEIWSQWHGEDKMFDIRGYLRQARRVKEERDFARLPAADYNP
jgi:hypothetical protein